MYRFLYGTLYCLDNTFSELLLPTISFSDIYKKPSSVLYMCVNKSTSHFPHFCTYILKIPLQYLLAKEYTFQTDTDGKNVMNAVEIQWSGKIYCLFSPLVPLHQSDNQLTDRGLG